MRWPCWSASGSARESFAHVSVGHHDQNFSNNVLARVHVVTIRMWRKCVRGRSFGLAGSLEGNPRKLLTGGAHGSIVHTTTDQTEPDQMFSPGFAGGP